MGRGRNYTDTSYAVASARPMNVNGIWDTEGNFAGEHLIIVGTDGSYRPQLINDRTVITGAAVTNSGCWYAWRGSAIFSTTHVRRAAVMAEMRTAAHATRALGHRPARLLTDNSAVARWLPEWITSGVKPDWYPVCSAGLRRPTPGCQVTVLQVSRDNLMVDAAHRIAALMRDTLRPDAEALRARFDEIARRAADAVGGRDAA